MTNADVAKFNMIEQQIRPWEVLDNQVLSVLNRLNREDFVSDPYKGLAYADCQIPLGNGVCMLPPTVEGRMLQALLIDADDRVLEIGSGCGYVTACLASLAQHVTSIDSNASIIDSARANVDGCGLDNVDFIAADRMAVARCNQSLQGAGPSLFYSPCHGGGCFSGA